MLCWCSVLAFTAICWYVVSRPAPPKVFGVYAQPGPMQWLKEIIFAALMTYRKKQVCYDDPPFIFIANETIY